MIESSRRPTVHVVDDDPDVRDSLRELFLSAGYPVQAYDDPKAFLDGFAPNHPGCLVTDVKMSPMNGLELLRAVKARRQNFPCIVLTGEADVPMAVDALKSGARDFIEKPVDAAALLSAVNAALEDAVQQDEKDRRRTEIARRMDRLSARERDVLAGLVEGRSNKELAIDLGISPRTVEVYRANIMNKMQAESLSELVRMSLTVEPPSTV